MLNRQWKKKQKIQKNQKKKKITMNQKVVHNNNNSKQQVKLINKIKKVKKEDNLWNHVQNF